MPFIHLSSTLNYFKSHSRITVDDDVNLNEFPISQEERDLKPGFYWEGANIQDRVSDIKGKGRYPSTQKTKKMKFISFFFCLVFDDKFEQVTIQVIFLSLNKICF